MSSSLFWTSDPSILIKNRQLIPDENMSLSETYNTYTRILIIVALLLWYNEYEYTMPVFIIGIILIVISYNNTSKKEGFKFPNTEQICNDCGFDPNLRQINAKYARTTPIQFTNDDSAKRSYANAKYELTPLEDTNGFRQIWRREPEDCGYFSMPPEPTTQLELQEEVPQGQANYIFRTTVDTHTFNDGMNGLNANKALVEQGFVDSTMQFRNLIGEYQDKFNRDRKHNCGDMKLMNVSAGGGSTF